MVETDGENTGQNINFSFDSDQSSAESDVDDPDEVVPTTPSTSTVEDIDLRQIVGYVNHLSYHEPVIGILYQI